jgi:ribosome maturation factor RimP
LKWAVCPFFICAEGYSDVAKSKDVENIVETAVTALGFEMVSCTLSSYQQNSSMRVLIDSPNGVTVGNCERVSRQIYALLAVELPTASEYALEVSSPGLDRPLTKLAHYERFIGCLVRIKLREALNDRKNFTGQLLSASKDKIEILDDGQTFTLNFENIEKTNLIPEVRFK